MKHRLPKSSKFIAPFIVKNGRKFRLKDYNPASTRHLHLDEREADKLLEESTQHLSRQQSMLYAQDRWALLLIFQAMDAGGKDSVIRHVMSGVNPQGCDVHTFKAPSQEELDHDFLWKAHRALPERGRIGIFNRSYYEEELAVRVHRHLLDNEHLPGPLVSKKLWKQRSQDINAFEQYLGRNGIVICKFFLHLSKDEQRERLLERLDDPNKNWKFRESDLLERKFWDEYMDAYENMIQSTATPEAPWYIIPADQKWFTHLAVSVSITHRLASLKLAYPKVSGAQKKELDKARQFLERESG